MAPLDSIDSVLLDDNEITPEKLAIMKLGPSEYDNDLFSEPDTPSRQRYSLNGRSQSNAVAHRSSTRQVSNATRRTSAFMSSHRSKMSMELTTQAESKFFALMELMSSASQEASSLKEYWAKLLTERQSSDREKEELLLQVSEITEELERKESEYHGYHGELVEKRNHVDKLLIELSTALNIIRELKKKGVDRDGELKDCHKQLDELKLSFSRLETEHKSLKFESERKVSKTTTVETERDSAKEEAEKHLREYRTMHRECTELREKFTHISTQLESSRKEISSLKERIRSAEHDKSCGLSERDRLQEELRKVRVKSEEYFRDYSQVTERFEHLQQEIKKTKESLRFAESQSEEYSSTIERLRYENKDTKERLNDSETRYTDILVKFEQGRRDCDHKDGRISALEFELTELRQSFEQKAEEYRLIIVERDQYRYDLENQRGGDHDKGHKVTTLEETLEKSESSLTEIRSELHRTTERIYEVERERDEVRHQYGNLNTELIELKQKIVSLRMELKTTQHARDHALKDVARFKSQYEEVSQTITEWDSSTREFEIEIENLRSMLHDAREEKERTVASLRISDKERDEYMAKYHEKCRQLEKLEESKSSHFHSHGKSGGRTSSYTTRSYKQERSSASQNDMHHHDGLGNQHNGLTTTEGH